MRAPWFLAGLLLPSLAFAQAPPQQVQSQDEPAQMMRCMPSPAFAELLLAEYGERPFVDGADGRGTQVRWFANPQSGTWTMAIYPRPEIACHALDGKSFRPANPVEEMSH